MSVTVTQNVWTVIGAGPVKIRHIGGAAVAIGASGAAQPHTAPGGADRRLASGESHFVLEAGVDVWAYVGGAQAATLELTPIPSLPPVFGGMTIPRHDYVACGYTGSDLTTVTYRLGGETGPIVGTMHMTYNAAHAVVSAWMELP